MNNQPICKGCGVDNVKLIARKSKNGSDRLREVCGNCGCFLGYKRKTNSDYIFKFGQYKDRHFSEVPVSYLVWIAHRENTSNVITDQVKEFLVLYGHGNELQRL